MSTNPTTDAAADNLKRNGPTFEVRVIAGDHVVVTNALLDTGCTMTTLDVAFAKSLGIDTETVIRIGRAEGTVEGHALRPFALEFGTQVVNFNTAVAVPSLRNRSGFDVLLGRDLLAFAHLRYDGPSALVQLSFHGEPPATEVIESVIMRDERGRAVSLRTIKRIVK